MFGAVRRLRRIPPSFRINNSWARKDVPSNFLLCTRYGMWGVTKSGNRVEIELFDDDECNPNMPQVWKDLINKYFFEDAKAKYRAPYK